MKYGYNKQAESRGYCCIRRVPSKIVLSNLMQCFSLILVEGGEDVVKNEVPHGQCIRNQNHRIQNILSIKEFCSILI